AHPLPRAPSPGPRARVLPRRARRAEHQAPGARARRVARDRLRGGRPPGIARRARARAEAVCGIVPVMNDQDTAVVLTERHDNVLLITLNRPEVRNAVNAALAAGVAGALDELDGDDSLSVGVLTGAGGLL